MNLIKSIYTTVSNGRLHIAADTQYVGSIDSYNNCFTQFIAWVFRCSINVYFDGKMRCVNKEQYTHLIESLTTCKINDLAPYRIFRSVTERATLPTGGRKMREAIASSDREALFRKLAFAISQGDTTKALLMIGKGAELDTPYYDRSSLSPSFKKDTSGLNANSAYNFTVFRAAPIMQANRNGNATVCKFLEEAGANLSVQGEMYTFKREITKVDRRLEVVMEPRSVPHHYHTQDSMGRPLNKVRYHTEYHPQLRERIDVKTEDSRSPSQIFEFDRTI